MPAFAETTRGRTGESPALGRARAVLAAFRREFGPGGGLPAEVDLLEEHDLPVAYRGGLGHRCHMTEWLERRYGGPMHLEVLAVREDDRTYARRMRLRAGIDGPVVLDGWMRARWSRLPGSLLESVRAGAEPLGRLLARTNLETTVEPLAFAPASAFDRPSGGAHSEYGRVATIRVDGAVAIEVLEFVAPRQTGDV